MSFAATITLISGTLVGSGVATGLSGLYCFVLAVIFSSSGCATMIGEDAESNIHPEHSYISLHSTGEM